MLGYWLRIIRTAIAHQYKPRITDLSQEIEMCYRVWPHEIDYNGHMNNSRYCIATEAVRVAYMIRSRFMGAFVRNKWIAPNVSQHMAFFRPLNAFQKFKVTCNICHVDDTMFYLFQKIIVKEVVHAVMLTKILVKSGRETLNPKDIAKQLNVAAPQNAAFAAIQSVNELDQYLRSTFGPKKAVKTH